LTEQANIELERLRSLPDGAYKWSWGPDVTKEEVLQLSNIYTRQDIHSGYNKSLPQGHMHGTWSVTGLTNSGTERFSPFSVANPENTHIMPPVSAGRTLGAAVQQVATAIAVPSTVTTSSTTSNPNAHAMAITAVKAWFESGDDTSSGKELPHSWVTASDAGNAWLDDETSSNLCPVLDADAAPTAVAALTTIAVPTAVAIPNAVATAMEAAEAWIKDKADDETGPEADGTTGSD